MHIPSTVGSQKLPEASATGQGQETSSPGRVRSVEPEVKLVGAECIESIDRVPNVERDSIEIAPAESVVAVCGPENERRKLYGVYPIVPLTWQDLEEVIRKIKKVEEIMDDPNVEVDAHTKLKLAGLTVQEFVIRMTLGQDDDEVLSRISTRIRSIREELYPVQPDYRDGMDDMVTKTPMDLWPVADQYGMSWQHGFSRAERRELEELDRKYRESGKKEIDEIKEVTDAVIQDVSEQIADMEIKEADVRCVLGLPSGELVLPEPSYTDRNIIRLVRRVRPEIYARAVQYNILATLDDELELGQLDRCIFVLHYICSECFPPDNHQPFNFKSMDLLPVFKDQIKYELDEGKITSFEAQQLVFMWLYCLYLFSLKCFNYRNEIGSLKLMRHGLPQCSESMLSVYERKCFDWIKLSLKDGFLDVADFNIVEQLLLYVLKLESGGLCRARRDMALDLAHYQIKTAVTSEQLLGAYSDLVHIYEIFKSESDFERVMVIASQYTVFPLFIRMWHDLGMAGRLHGWSSDSIKPGCAIEILVRFGRQPEKLQEMKSIMDNTAEYIKGSSKQTPCMSEFAPRIALYYYLTNRKEEGEAILEYGNMRCSSFLQFLLFIAEEQFGKAIEFMEEVLGRDKKHVRSKENQKDFQRIKSRIISIMGLLYKKIAEDEKITEVEKKQHFERALNYLMKQAKTRKELYLPIAEIQEKLGRFRDAYESYGILENIFESSSPASYGNCQLYGIRKAKERLADFMDELARVESAGYEDSLADVTQKEFEAQRKPRTRKKRSSRKPATQPVRKLSFRARETVLSSTPGQVQEADPQNKTLVACAEVIAIKENDMQRADNKKNEPVVDVEEMALSRTITTDKLTEEVVERKMRESKRERYELYHGLLFLADVNYDDLLARHDYLYNNAGDVTLELLILQHKMWTLRHKTFDAYTLEYEANRTGVSVVNIKTGLRLEILNTLFSNLEKIRTLWTDRALPVNWKSNPEIIVRSADFQRFRKNETVAGRFWIQLGAQFSTIAHVMQDISLDQLQKEEITQYRAAVFGDSPPGDFGELYRLFYQCRDCIDPEHQLRTC